MKVLHRQQGHHGQSIKCATHRKTLPVQAHSLAARSEAVVSVDDGFYMAVAGQAFGVCLWPTPYD